MSFTTRFCLLLGGSFLSLAGVAAGGSITPSSPVTLQIFGTDPGGFLQDQDSPVFQIDADPSGDFSSVDEFLPGTSGSRLWDVTSLSISGNVDPIVFLSFSVTNTASTPTLITFVTTLPTGPVGPATVFGGSVSGTLLDTDPNSAELSPGPSGFVYEGNIDGNVVLSLLDDSTSVTLPATAASIPTEIVGLPGPTLPGPAVSSTIGLTLEFLLSPGDTATFGASFVVEAVPEPTTCVLALVTAGSMAGMRRRR
ncbi:MAG: hypothetical protein AAF596_00345 [Planctomycetota bacterium]